MLCCEVSHKVLRKETVLEFLYDLKEKLDKRRFYDEATKKVVGEIVLTRCVCPLGRLI
jgi:aubergine-like protein